MKLYTFFRSSASYRVRIGLNLKALTYESIPMRLRAGEHRTPDYREINPQALVPTLVDEFVQLPQSLAILEYLDELYPTTPLLPRRPADRAYARSMAMAIACDIHPLNNLRVLDYLKTDMQQSQDAITRWYRVWVAQGLFPLEQMARRFSKTGRYLYGDAVSLADICLVPQLYNARRFECDLSPYPTLVAVGAHLESIAAFAAAAPERQPDAVNP